MNRADDAELDSWIRHVVDAAGSDAPPAHGWSPMERLAARRRRWPVVAAAALVAVAGTATIAVLLRNGAERVVPGTAPEPTVVQPSTIPTAAPSTSATPQVSDAASSTLAPAPALTRPIIDLDGCTRTSAQVRNLEPQDRAYTLFSSEPMAFQLITTPNGSLVEQFAVVGRLFADQRLDPATGDSEVNGQPARVSFNGERWGELRWRLADGSEAYLRTSSMTEDELLALASSLQPRSADAAVPGFDLPDGRFVVSDEAVGTFAVGRITESSCEFEQGGWMLASIVEGPPLGQAVLLTDRPKEHGLAVRELDDGRLLVVSGRQDVGDRAGEALRTVRQATDAEWAELTGSDLPDDDADLSSARSELDPG